MCLYHLGEHVLDQGHILRVQWAIIGGGVWVLTQVVVLFVFQYILRMRERLNLGNNANVQRSGRLYQLRNFVATKRQRRDNPRVLAKWKLVFILDEHGVDFVLCAPMKHAHYVIEAKHLRLEVDVNSPHRQRGSVDDATVGDLPRRSDAM